MSQIQPPPSYYGNPYPNEPNPQFPQMGPNVPYGGMENQLRVDPTSEEVNSNNYFTSYLKDKVGRKVSVYCSFTDAADWHDRVFQGTIASSGDDYIILDETSIHKSILILSVYVHFVEFDDVVKK